MLFIIIYLIKINFWDIIFIKSNKVHDFHPKFAWLS